MPSDIIQWFPGHMAKTRRLIKENLPYVDAVIPMLDARIPKSSQNPEILRLVGNKPMLTLLNKASLADAKATEKWKNHMTSKTQRVLACDCITGMNINLIPSEIAELCSEKLQKYEAKGMHGRTLKIMILGIPNCGKSSLINKLSKSKKTKVENRPGVTLTKQWVTTDVGLDLLDMPGVLWPKFDDDTVGENLAATGAIKDLVVDSERIALAIVNRLRRLYPELLYARYKIESKEEYLLYDDYDFFRLIGKKRGFLISGGEIDEERCAKMLIEEFRSCKIGKISLEHI